MIDFPHVHPDYVAQLPLWTKWRDASAGEEAVKAKKEAYLPKLYGQSGDSYADYLSRAEWYNASGKTVDAMVGAHHRQPLAAYLPGLETLQEKACHNQSLAELSRKATRELWRVGKFGLLAEILPGEAPQLYLYTAESIVNWRYDDDVLRFVILKEHYAVPSQKSPYVYEQATQYRVCELVDGVYVQRVLRLAVSGQQKAWVFVPELEVHPIKSNGESLTEIPFVVVEYEDNNGTAGSPIADIVSINLKHYRVTANKSNYLNICSTPILHIDGLPEDDRPKTKWALGTGVTIYTMGGSSSFTEPSGGALDALASDLAAKEEQMARLGASFLRAPKKAVETAEALSITQSGETSVLQDVANVLSKGFTTATRFLSRWLGKAEEQASVVLSSQFVSTKVESWEAEFLLKLFLAGQIDAPTLFEALEKGGLLQREWIAPLLERAQAAQKAAIANGTKETTDDDTRPDRGEPVQAAGERMDS